MTRLAFAFLLLLCVSAQAQLSGGVGGFPGPGTVHSSASYVGPGDVVSGATAFYSCARAYNAAYANGTNPLCDLVDSSTGTVSICTLRVATTGFVDLTGSYCTGSATPAVACAAASGGSCKVKTMRDQSGNGNDVTNATAAQLPALTFSALNSLPGLTTVSATPTFLLSTSTVSLTQPNVTIYGVLKRTGSTSAIATAIGFTGTSYSIGMVGSANTGGISSNGSNVVSSAAAENTFHSVLGVFNGAASVSNINGTETTGNAGASNIAAATIRFARGNASTPDGVVMEAGAWPSQFNGTQRADMNTNIHSAANGYNF